MTTTELIQSYYAAFNAADWEGMLTLLSDDVSHDVNESAREGGKAAFRVFLERMNRCYRERIEPLEVMVNADGSRAAAEYVVSGTYLQTDAGLPEARGQSYRLPGGAFFEVRDGRIARVTNYYNLQDWVRQVS
jgi:steroid delta-isomerase-like uncharacterized protein